MTALRPRADLLIVGGGVGGCAAALAAASAGRNVILTEPTDWIGGQLTSQAVPPDEHRWIEWYGCTKSYRCFREGVRSFMRAWYPLNARAKADPLLNPGGGSVSRLCHEPRVALAVLEGMLAPYRSAGRLEVRHHRVPIEASVDGDRVRAVTFRSDRTDQVETVEAAYVLDATELGDLLPLTNCEYVSGAESQADHGEPHASARPGPGNVQALTWCFPMAYDAGGRHLIDRPAQWLRWRDYVPALQPPWPGRLLSWTWTNPFDLQPRTGALFPGDGDISLWQYRRIVCRDHYLPEAAPDEVTLVNWPQNDYLERSIIDEPAREVVIALEEAKQLSLCLFYWLQTEAPRPDGGTGYPGLHLCPDMVGTDDGLAMAPYIRESRRIRAQCTVTELHVGEEARAGWPAEQFADSVGIGYYRIDLHPATGGDNYIDIPSLPFQIPLGALLPVRLRNLLPACKNLGVTRITNGCYRLHPVEWNIGEAAGLLAAFCLDRGCEPSAVRESAGLLREFQSRLADSGVEMEWPQSG